jgi:hypothetical protein
MRITLIRLTTNRVGANKNFSQVITIPNIQNGTDSTRAMRVFSPFRRRSVIAAPDFL